MRIKNVLKAIANYLTTARAVGHTTTMIRGVQNVDHALVLVHSSRYRDTLKTQIPNATIVVVENASALAGFDLPLAVDNAALFEICRCAANEIERLESLVETLKTKLTKDEHPTT